LPDLRGPGLDFVTDFFQNHSVLFALLCAAVGIGWGAVLTVRILKLPAGTERMQEIARAVQEGASAYLRRQYLTIAGVAAAIFLGIGLWNDLGWFTAFGFLIGAVLSAGAGFIGMNVAVRANVRTAEAARGGVKPALAVAFGAGSVTGLLVVGLGLLGGKPSFTLDTEVDGRLEVVEHRDKGFARIAARRIRRIVDGLRSCRCR